MAVARDGTGGLVYLKHVGGVAHVFVSRLLGGVFQGPEQVDATLPTASSQPVIAAASGGVLAVAFINNGSLVAVTRASTGSPYTAPLTLVAGASNPALAMTIFGKAYLAFTTGGAGGHDVRAAYFARGSWAIEPPPLDAQPGDDAGAGSGRPAVAAANDGVGIVAWGEAGHVYTRRVVATSPSTVSERADVPSLGGWPEISADEPAISAGGDSSYADVTFHETFAGGTATQSRVLSSRLRASLYDIVSGVDGLSTPGTGGADQPQVALNEYGRGFVTSARTDSDALIASHATTNGVINATFRADSLTNASRPYAVPATAGLSSTLIAWQHDPGPLGTPEIRARYAPDGSTLGPELALSSPAQGPTDAAGGLDAAGDVIGDAAVAWLQGAPGARQVVVSQMYQPLGAITPVTAFAYVRTAQPILAWTPARALWGPIAYTVTVDGFPVGQTTATSLRVPAGLHDGPHLWRVQGVNPAGLSSLMRLTRFFTDTVAPVVRLSVTGRRRISSPVHAYVAYSDAPPPEPPAAASGIASVRIRWGDGTSLRITHGKFHVYKRPGRYRITVTVTDRAGNATTVSRVIRIAARKTYRPRKGAGRGKPGQRHGARR